MKPNHDEIGVGPTQDLSLRVSIATLVRVVFPSEHDDWLLALERKATFREHEQDVIVKAQPFGGAACINDLARIREITGRFHFDRERSPVERKTTLSYAGIILEDNVSALWDSASNSKFQYIAD